MEVEQDRVMGSAEGILGCLTIPACIAIGWYAGWKAALATLAAVWVVCLVLATVSQVRARLQVPPEAKAASRLAIAEFERLYPNDSVATVAVRAVEPERFVFSVRYKMPNTVAHPTPRRYFAVTRTEPVVVTELAVEDWRPRGEK